MNPLFFAIGGFVILIALCKRELLVEKESFRGILIISTALFLIGMVLHFMEAWRDSISGSLLSPLISLGLFRLCRRIFLNRFKREPKDTFLNWQAGMAPDRFFNVLYFVSASWLWAIIPFLTKQLAKVGW